jgi:hypothetical protein
LAEQAEAALPYYEEHQAEWEEWINKELFVLMIIDRLTTLLSSIL